jgi:hypothetical protein
MCDPATLAVMGITAVASLLGGGDTVVNPPSAAPPAIAAPTSRKAGADVRVGREAKKKAAEGAVNPSGFKETRKAAVSLGGLGRSGLTL